MQAVKISLLFIILMRKAETFFHKGFAEISNMNFEIKM
jgi:hypothetical protein